VKNTQKLLLATVLLVFVFSILLSGTAQALSLPNLKELMLSAAIIAAVKHFGKDLNNFINKLLAQHDVAIKQATKVVPIISAGEGLAVGAAQVTGAADRVRLVKAVGQFEASFSSLRGKLLLPVSSSNPSKSKVVKGVGVSALIDVKVTKF